MKVSSDIVEQVRAWHRKCIVASDYPRLRDLLDEEDPAGGREDDEDEDGDWICDLLFAGVGIGFLREAANHYPHPVAGVLLDAALAELVPQVDPYMIGGLPAQAVSRNAVRDIIKKILEEPDALLG